MLEIAGEYGGQFGPLEGNRELNPAGLFLQSRPATIYAGSNEIQRNILAKNVLELPAVDPTRLTLQRSADVPRRRHIGGGNHMAQTIEGFVGTSLDDARMSPIHWRVFALISAGYFFDVCDYVILGALIPDMVRSGFATPAQIATVASATLLGLFVGTLAQGEFTDRFGRKTVYQFNLLLYGLATIAAAFSPNYIWLAVLRFIAGIGLGAEQPLCFAYAGEYAPKKIRGRFIAGVQMIGGAWSWPLSTLFALAFRDTLGWRGIWIVIGVCALIVFLFRFSLPESPRWLAIHGQGDRAIELLRRMGIAGPTGTIGDGRREQHAQRSDSPWCSACTAAASSPAWCASSRSSAWRWGLARGYRT